MNYEEILKLTTNKIEALEVGTEFFLKDLFDGTDWKNFKRGEKLSLGRYFKNQVVTEKITNVIYIGKAQNNSAIYKKS